MLNYIITYDDPYLKFTKIIDLLLIVQHIYFYSLINLVGIAFHLFTINFA